MRAQRRRFISQHLLTQEQAMWLCRAILTHYRNDNSTEEGEVERVAYPNRALRSLGYKRGRNWVMHPVGYDLKESLFGTERSGIRVSWAGLAALPISQRQITPEEYRTYNLYGLVNNHRVSIAVYRITEVIVTSTDSNFIDYVKQCFSRLQNDVEEIPEYNPKQKTKPLSLQK
jgi:hypothetical protein